MNLRDVVLEKSVTWLNSTKTKSIQTESSIALRRLKAALQKKAIFMKIIKTNLANARTPSESVNWLYSFISLSNLTKHLGLFPCLN